MDYLWTAVKPSSVRGFMIESRVVLQLSSLDTVLSKGNYITLGFKHDYTVQDKYIYGGKFDHSESRTDDFVNFNFDDLNIRDRAFTAFQYLQKKCVVENKKEPF